MGEGNAGTGHRASLPPHPCWVLRSKLFESPAACNPPPSPPLPLRTMHTCADTMVSSADQAAALAKQRPCGVPKLNLGGLNATAQGKRTPPKDSKLDDGEAHRIPAAPMSGGGQPHPPFGSIAAGGRGRDAGTSGPSLSFPKPEANGGTPRGFLGRSSSGGSGQMTGRGLDRTSEAAGS